MIILAAVLIVLAAIGGLKLYQKFHPGADAADMADDANKHILHSYNAQEEIDLALERYEDENTKECDLITEPPMLEKQLSINFEGSTDAATVQTISKILINHNIKSTFFIPAMDIAEDDDIVKYINQCEGDIENGTLSYQKHFDEYTAKENIENLCRAQEIYASVANVFPDYVKFPATKLNADLARQAESVSFNAIVTCSRYINETSFRSEKAAKRYVDKLPKGAIITVKLDGALDDTEYEEKITDLRPAKDKQPELKETKPVPPDNLFYIIEWICKAVEEKEIETVYVKDIEANSIDDLLIDYDDLKEEIDYENLVEQTNFIYTTDRTMAFTFRGIESAEKVDAVIAKCAELGISGTYFITGDEIEKYPENAAKLKAAGFEIGNGGAHGGWMGESSYEECADEIYMGDLLLSQAGYDTDLYMPSTAEATEDMRAAATALEVSLVGYNFAPMKSEYYKQHLETKDIMYKTFGNWKRVFTRGDICYFNISSANNADEVSDLLQTIYDRKLAPTRWGSSMVTPVTFSEASSNTWSYPAYGGAAGRIKKSGNLAAPLASLEASRYIGNEDVALSGFDSATLATLDTSGRIGYAGHTVFLTFDDWGDEQTIGRLLCVLRNHGVRATFFIKTQYISDTGYNLVRAIAEAGHDVASHTDTHMTVDITPDNLAQLQNDLVRSNQKLAAGCGDTGRLTYYFRPPTLAINALGMATIFDCGYHYIVQGDVSTHDYEAGSADALLNTLLYGKIKDDGQTVASPQDGTIFVMHMSENAAYTPAAVDKYLTYQQSLGGAGFNFARLSDYLQP